VAEQQGIDPSATVAPLLKNCWSDYKTPDEFAQALAAALEISAEAGQKGEPGAEGDDGSDSLATYWENVLILDMDIPIGVDRVDTGIDLNGKILQVTSGDAVGPTPSEAFGVGMIDEDTVCVFVFNYPSNVTIPGGGLDPREVEREGWKLKVYELQQVPAPTP